MKISDDGLRHLMRIEPIYFEVTCNKRKKPIVSYVQSDDPIIGVSHKISKRNRKAYACFLSGKRKMSMFQVKRTLQRDIERIEPIVKKKITAPVTQSMWDSLMSLAFNCGPNSYAVKDTIDHINKKEYKKAAKSIKDGPVKTKGQVNEQLLKRRIAEAKMFLLDGIPKEGSKSQTNNVLFATALGLTAFLGTRYVKGNLGELVDRFRPGEKNEKT